MRIDRLIGNTKLFASVQALVAASVLGVTIPAHAGFLFVYGDASGLSAEAEFTMLDATTLQIRLKNTSTGAPGGFDAADQLLTSVSWDFGAALTITGGSAMTGPSSQSVNFSILNVGANADVSGEWGFGNLGATGLLANFVTGNAANATGFGGLNLDGPADLNGPQGGLVADPAVVALGGMGAIRDEIYVTVSLSDAITSEQLLADLLANGTIVEFGSDAAFIPGELIPAPGALALLVCAALVGTRRRR